MRHGFLAVLICCCLFASLCRADDLVAADKAISGDEILLKDKRVLRVAGIKNLSPDARDFLQNLAGGHDLVLQNVAGDRYGRLQATVFVKNRNEPVEEDLLNAGMAFVYPASGDDPDLDHWLALEKTARLARRGFWATHPDTPADHAEPLYGQYGFVSGAVVKAERIKNKLYLNFGPDWRTDFTITIAAHDLRAFKKADIDLLGLEGKKVRVRGWVKKDFGPMIVITDPHQLEILNYTSFAN